MALPVRCPRCAARRIEGVATCPRCQWRFEPEPASPASATRPVYNAAAAKWIAPDPPTPPVQPVSNDRRPGGMHAFLRLLLTIWTIAYPVVACSPLLIGAAAGGSGAAEGGFVSLVVGGFLFAPWIVGVIVLGILVVLSR
jgi:hypothetical protein